MEYWAEVHANANRHDGLRLIWFRRICAKLAQSHKLIRSDTLYCMQSMIVYLAR
jgi:hypothetical protein